MADSASWWQLSSPIHCQWRNCNVIYSNYSDDSQWLSPQFCWKYFVKDFRSGYLIHLRFKKSSVSTGNTNKKHLSLSLPFDIHVPQLTSNKDPSIQCDRLMEELAKGNISLIRSDDPHTWEILNFACLKFSSKFWGNTWIFNWFYIDIQFKSRGETRNDN